MNKEKLIVIFFLVLLVASYVSIMLSNNGLTSMLMVLGFILSFGLTVRILSK